MMRGAMSSPYEPSRGRSNQAPCRSVTGYPAESAVPDRVDRRGMKAESVTVPATAPDSPTSWVALRVDLPVELEEPVASLLFDAGARGVVTETPAVGRCRLEASFPAADPSEVTRRVTPYLASLAEIEPAAHAVSFALAPVPEVDWVELARRHHRPLAVGRRLVVAPPWDLPVAGDRELIVIEPGMAFGTGQHATTRG